MYFHPIYPGRYHGRPELYWMLMSAPQGGTNDCAMPSHGTIDILCFSFEKKKLGGFKLLGTARGPLHDNSILFPILTLLTVSLRVQEGASQATYTAALIRRVMATANAEQI